MCDEVTKPESVLDGFDRSNLEWKLHERASGNCTADQSIDEPWLTSHGHFHNDYGAGPEKFDQELGSSQNWHGTWTIWCWLRFDMRTM